MTMPTWVSWIITCECQASDSPAIAELAAEMTRFFAENEPFTTHFEWSISPEKNSVYLHERYSDSAQALAHVSSFGENYGAQFMALLKPSSVVVFGFPSSELKQQLEGFSPLFTEYFEGFQR